jgi:hypothetical protein
MPNNRVFTVSLIMRLAQALFLILLPTICHASPWDTGNFLGNGDGVARLLYWLVSVVVMIVFLGVHFVVIRLSVEMRDEQRAIALRVRKYTRIPAIVFTTMSFYYWMQGLSELNDTIFYITGFVYASVFVLFIRG